MSRKEKRTKRNLRKRQALERKEQEEEEHKLADDALVAKFGGMRGKTASSSSEFLEGYLKPMLGFWGQYWRVISSSTLQKARVEDERRKISLQDRYVDALMGNGRAGEFKTFLENKSLQVNPIAFFNSSLVEM